MIKTWFDDHWVVTMMLVVVTVMTGAFWAAAFFDQGIMRGVEDLLFVVRIGDGSSH